MNTKTDPPQTTFLGLPREIRDMIYKEALSEHNVEVKWECSTNQQPKIFKTYGTAPIMYVNKLVHAEVEPLWYAQSHFVLDFGWKPIGGIKRFVKKIGSDNAKSIRKISLRFQGESRPTTGRMHAPLYTDTEWPGYWTKGFGLLHQIHAWTRPFPRLQDFRLKFHFCVIDKYKPEVTIDHPAYDLEDFAPLIKNIQVLLRKPDAYVGKCQADGLGKDRVVALVRHYQRLVIERDGPVFKHYQCRVSNLVNEGDGLVFTHYNAHDLKDNTVEEEMLQARIDGLRLALR
ncbi:MAG: hypothetical protein Q9212_002852 [Teloschistes hypoglaucus]